MSFMPSPGSFVKLKDGREGIVTKVTPDGSDDRVYVDGCESERITVDDIAEVVDERP